MSTDVNTLMEMGFPENRSEKALAKTGYKGVETAMEWLFAHADDPDIDDPFEVPKGKALGSSVADVTDDGPSEVNPESTENETAGEGDVTAKSLKCDDCGKLLRSTEAAEMHAARSGHSNFSESTEEVKPLTEEEKREQMSRLQEKMKQKRMEKEEHDKKEALQREKNRRVQGRDMIQQREKLAELEMKKMVEQRKREKEEEKLARQRVKDQIEKDKRDRAAKASGAAAAAAPAPSVSNTPKPQTPPQETKDYDKCRIQIRLTNGQALTETFGAKEPLSAVRLYVEMHRTDLPGPFTLMTSFPRKVFESGDMDKPLTTLGLVPSAVLIVTKSQ